MRKPCVRSAFLSVSIVLLFTSYSRSQAVAEVDRISLTEKTLTWEGDLASRMIDGIDRFLLDEISKSKANRDSYWNRVTSEQHPNFKAATRRLHHILGLRDERPSEPSLRLMSSVNEKAEIASNQFFRVIRVRWPALSNPWGEIHGEGLLLEPKKDLIANV